MRVGSFVCLLSTTAALFSAIPAHASNTEDCSRMTASAPKPLQTGDSASLVNLSAARSVGTLRSIHIEACSGELRIVPGTDERVHLQITSREGSRTLDNFLDQFTSQDGEVLLVLSIPKALHSVVTVAMPRDQKEFASRVELGRGKVDIKGEALRGNRQIDVGAGSVYAELDGDHDYAKLIANIGLGHLSDTRIGGHGKSFAVSRELKGDGDGELNINVGAGSIHLTQMPVIPSAP